MAGRWRVKVELEKQMFVPIVVTLESQTEKEDLVEALRSAESYLVNSVSCSVLKKLRIRLEQA